MSKSTKVLEDQVKCMYNYDQKSKLFRKCLRLYTSVLLDFYQLEGVFPDQHLTKHESVAAQVLVSWIKSTDEISTIRLDSKSGSIMLDESTVSDSSFGSQTNDSVIHASKGRFYASLAVLVKRTAYFDELETADKDLIEEYSSRCLDVFDKAYIQRLLFSEVTVTKEYDEINSNNSIVENKHKSNYEYYNSVICKNKNNKKYEYIEYFKQIKHEQSKPDSDPVQNTGVYNLDFDKYVKGDKLKIYQKKLELGDCLALGKWLRTREDLEVIELYDNGMLLEGLKPVADALKHLMRLRTLDISGNDFGPAGARYLADSLASNTRLSRLRLGSCDLGDEGLAALAPLLPRLSDLRIGGNGITDGGLRHLERFCEDPVDKSRERYLSLYSNQITDAGCETLADLFEDKCRIDEIEIGLNKVTQTGIDRLQKFIKKVNY